jgi:hypothetical protein
MKDKITNRKENKQQESIINSKFEFNQEMKNE